MAEGGPPAAVLLDCLGTLLWLEPPAPRLRAALAVRGIEVSGEAAEAAFAVEIAYYKEHHLEGSDAPSLERLRRDCARVMGDALGLASERLDAVREAMLCSIRFEPYEDAMAALAALREAGPRLVVTSNWDCSLERVLSSAGLRPLVDAVVTSAEVGAAKPEAAVFRAALELAGVDESRAVCVGDSLDTDVAGARAAGIAALLLDRSGAPSEERAHPAGDGHAPVARSLDEAVSLILAR